MPVQDAPLSDLERAFAEARKRSQEQGGAAKVAAAAVKPKPKPKAPEDAAAAPEVRMASVYRYHDFAGGDFLELQ